LTIARTSWSGGVEPRIRRHQGIRGIADELNYRSLLLTTARQVCNLTGQDLRLYGCFRLPVYQACRTLGEVKRLFSQFNTGESAAPTLNWSNALFSMSNSRRRATTMSPTLSRLISSVMMISRKTGRRRYDFLPSVDIVPCGSSNSLSAVARWFHGFYAAFWSWRRSALAESSFPVST